MKEEYDFSNGTRGAVVSTGKTRIIMRLDIDIIDWFRQQAEQQGGGNYLDMINDVLKDHIKRA